VYILANKYNSILAKINEKSIGRKKEKKDKKKEGIKI